MQQIADHMARSRPDEAEAFPPIARRIRAVKWRLWHGRVARAIRDLQELLNDLTPSNEIHALPTSATSQPWRATLDVYRFEPQRDH